MCKVYTGYCGTSEIEHGLCACTVDNPLGLSFRTGAQTMLYLSLIQQYFTVKQIPENKHINVKENLSIQYCCTKM